MIVTFLSPKGGVPPKAERGESPSGPSGHLPLRGRKRVKDFS